MNFETIITTIRSDRGLTREVPAFDPNNGNEKARYLFLLEAPGPKAIKSGVISFENPDPTAKNLHGQLTAAGIDRKDIALWNIVPWYLGNEAGTTIRAAIAKDVSAGIEYLSPLVKAMPNLSCIVLVGGAARQAHLFLSRITTARIVSCHHPSARSLNSNPDASPENIRLFSFIKATT